MQKPKFKIDEILLILIVAFIAIVVSIYDKGNEISVTEAEKITTMILDDHDISFANNGVVDENKLKEVQSMSYKDFKDSLNVKNDFCVYIEDENGNIILAKGKDGLCKE